MTVIQFCEQNAIGYDSACKTLVQRGNMSFTKHEPLTDDVKTALMDYASGTRQRKPANKTARLSAPGEMLIQTHKPGIDWNTEYINKAIMEAAKEQPKPRRAPQPKPQPEKASDRKVLWLTIAVNFFSVGLTMFGLIWFAKWPGAILGAMFASYLVAAVLVCRERQKGDTSAAALKTVKYMEAGAAVLHTFTFYSVLPDTDIYFRVAAAAVLASFASFMSYRSVLFVRDYNAEVAEPNTNTDGHI